jgi:hypothetical protein
MMNVETRINPRKMVFPAKIIKAISAMMINDETILFAVFEDILGPND